MHKIVVGLVAVSALALGGCSLVGGDPQPSTGSASEPPPASSVPSGSAAPSASTTTSTDPSTAPTAGSTPGGGADQLGQPFATRKSSQGGTQIVLTLYPVIRDGTTSHLNFTLAADVAKDDRVQIAAMLSDNNNEAGDRGPWAADGLQLIDSKNSKVYLVASDGKGQCLCSRALADQFLQDNQPLVLSASFAAPPADVTTVDVRVPTFGTVVRVPVA